MVTVVVSMFGISVLLHTRKHFINCHYKRPIFLTRDVHLYIAPLVWKKSDGRIYVVGIGSWVLACGYDEYPDAHADVRNEENLDWIYETISKILHLKMINLFGINVQ